jgi:hypothetical protein
VRKAPVCRTPGEGACPVGLEMYEQVWLQAWQLDIMAGSDASPIVQVVLFALRCIGGGVTRTVHYYSDGVICSQKYGRP